MLNIFIADDSVVVRGRLRDALEESGTIKVIGEAADAKTAIARIRKLDPQVVIIDIRMPEGGGMPVLQDIKSHSPERKAYILTSFPFPQYREAYMNAGADQFFDKNSDIPKLTEILTEMAEKE
jgi:DNA-binding NarL/FixJ family response regulator